MFARALTIWLTSSIVMMGADFAGTWKLNQAKSKLPTEYTSQTMKVTETGPETYQIVFDVVPKSGAAQHRETTATFDGKSHPSKGTPSGVTEISEHPDSSTEIDKLS
jgi:hypothetical protein